jgi:multiple sugar transport system permease protein
MIIFPIIYTVYLSFHNSRGSVVEKNVFVGLDNYIKLFTSPDKRFLNACGRTAIFSVIALAIEVPLGIGIALLLNRKFFGKSIVKTIMLLPMVATPVAIGMVFKLIYEPTIGVLNYILKHVGLPTGLWLGSTKTVLYSIILIDIWQWTPMIMLITFAGLSALPGDPRESAIVDGANRWQILTKITMPMLMPTIMSAIILRLVDVIKTFDIIFSLTMGGPGYTTETLNILAYRQAFENFRFGEASATLIIFFIIVMSISMLFLQFRKKVRVEY